MEEAARPGLDAITLTDHDGLYGAVRFAEAARELGVRTGFGAELSLGLTEPQNGVPDPAGTHPLVIARGLEGYQRLCRTISTGQLAGEKGAVWRELVGSGPVAATEQLRVLVDPGHGRADRPRPAAGFHAQRPAGGDELSESGA